MALLAPELVGAWLPQPYPAGAASGLALDGPCGHGLLGILSVHGGVLVLHGLHGFHGLHRFHGLHGLHHFHGLHGLHGLHAWCHLGVGHGWYSWAWSVYLAWATLGHLAHGCDTKWVEPCAKA